MNDFVNEFETRIEAPSPEQIDALIAKAHRMRQDAARDAVIGLWGMLRRNMARSATVGRLRHA